MCHSGKGWVSLIVVHPPLERILHILDSEREVDINFTLFRNLLANGDIAKATIIAFLLAYVDKSDRQDNDSESLALSAICMSSCTGAWFSYSLIL